jgi:hypothetical protein
MNRVFNLAQDNNVNIYYTDTDSIHIQYNQINKLSNLYYKKYNTNLIGDEFGQFKDEFKHTYNTYATESIYLGKKSYLNLLENGDYHIRMKSIPKNVIEYKCKTEFDNNMISLYEYMKTNEVCYDLLCCEKKYKQNNNYSLQNCEIFNRIISF